MSTLLMRLSGPMQSWGTQSRFSERDTGLEPSKSGVIGLLCAALGRPRHAAVDNLVALRMGVRVDREGVVKIDYHTAGGWHRREDAGYGVPDPSGKGFRTVVSHRYYLADAEFLVGLEGDREILRQLDRALARPCWQLYLGRKAFVPSAPVRLPDDEPWGPGLRDQNLVDALTSYPWLGDLRQTREEPPARLRLVLDADAAEGGEVRLDVPVSFAERRFAARSVRTEWIEPTRVSVPCTSRS